MGNAATSSSGVQRASLALVASVWASRQSGRSTYSDGGSLGLIRGELADRRALNQLALGLADPALGFEAGRVRATGRTVEPARLLLDAAHHVANANIIDDALGWALVDGPAAEPALLRLPLSAATRTVLDQRGQPPGPLGKVLRVTGTPLADVRDELSALLALGILQLRPYYRASGYEGPERRSRKRDDNVAFRHKTLLEQLQRTLQLYSRSDDWTIIGVPPDSPPHLIRRACQHARGRYASLLRDENMPDPVRTKARMVLRKVGEATDRLQPGVDASLGADDAHAMGRKALADGRYTLAVTWFGKAVKQRPSDAPAIAGLGWATFRDTALPRDERRAEGLRLLGEAVELDPLDLRARLWLARALRSEGRKDDALREVRSVLNLDPTRKEAVRLAEKLTIG